MLQAGESMDAYYHGTTTTRATAKAGVDGGSLTSKEAKKAAASPKLQLLKAPLALNSWTATTFTHSIGGQKKQVKKERPGIVMPPGLGSHNKERHRTTPSMDYFTKAVTTGFEREEATNEAIEDHKASQQPKAFRRKHRKAKKGF